MSDNPPYRTIRDFGMNEDKLNELLERCESPIERQLLKKLYPRLRTNQAQELCAQHTIDYYNDMSVTIPDFAFSDMKIAVYCDGFSTAAGNREKFKKDRSQSRELQLRDWIVLRFAGSEIKHESEMVVETIHRAIEKVNREQEVLREDVADVPVESHTPDNLPPLRLRADVSEASGSVKDSKSGIQNVLQRLDKLLNRPTDKRKSTLHRRRYSAMKSKRGK